MPILLLTRPRPQCEAFAAQCRASGFAGPVIVSPVIDIVYRLVPADLTRYPTLLFTSAHGVAAIRGGFAPGQCAFAVGANTAEAARCAGLPCASADGDVDTLLSLVLNESPKGPCLHLRGVHSHGDLAARLTAAGLPTAEAVVYDQIAQPLSETARAAVGGPDPVIVPLFSSRSARILGADVPAVAAPRRILALSQAVADAWPHDDLVTIAARPEAGAMADLVNESAFG